MTNVHQEILDSCKGRNDLELLFSIIRKRDSGLLQKVLKEKSVHVLEFNDDGWFPLHEAVELGYLDITKVIVEFASKNKINVLREWDGRQTSHRKFGTDMFKGIDHRLREDEQTSFLRLAVRTEQLDLIKFFVTIYKDHYKPQHSIRERLHISQLRISPNGRAYLLGTPRGNEFINRPVFEAMLESVPQTNILKLLVKAFPQYLNHNYGQCGILQYAIECSEFQSIALLLPLLYSLHRDMSKSGYPGASCQGIAGLHCLKWTFKNNDTQLLKQFFDAAGQDQLAVNLASSWMRDDIYFLLFYTCRFGTVKGLQFLIETGLSLYEFCNSASANLLAHQPRCESNRIIKSIEIHEYYDNVIRVLQKLDDKVPLAEPKYQMTALFWAAVQNNIDVLKYLLTVVDKKKFYCLQLSSPIFFVAQYFLFETLQLLLEAGFHVDDIHPLPSGIKSFLGDCLFFDEYASMNTLEVLIRYGAVEYTFGHRLESYRQFLVRQWFAIAQFLKNILGGIPNYRIIRHASGTEPTLGMKIRTPPTRFIKDKFDLFLQHVGLFTKNLDKTSNLEPSIPSLKQLSRFVIRCCVVRKHQTLQPIYYLSLPCYLKKYLFCFDVVGSFSDSHCR